MTDLALTSAEHAHVVVAGELDASAVGRFSAAIDAAGDDVRVDLSQCTFIDSTGLSALLSAHDVRVRSTGSLTLVSPSNVVHRLLEICGLTNTLAIEAGTDRADEGAPGPIADPIP